MSQELIYTSSPKGLKLGARGFCTVASTPGMAKNLADRLESLTGYRHLFPPGSPEAHLNPVNYSYLRFTLGGQPHYVLSRISDAGLDYTQRTNKLAHHIALQQSELPPAGPAWLASQSGVFETTWSREPELLPENGRRVPLGRLDADVCSAWKAATGDAGWAGVLAEHVLKSGTDEAYVIYRPGTDVLELFVEAQSLLSPDQRWAATFSTYFTNLPPGVECRWRGVVDASPEAIRARRSPDKCVIDLAEAARQAPYGKLVVVARNGSHVEQGANDCATQGNIPGPTNEQSKNGQLPVGRDSPIEGSGRIGLASASQPPALPLQRDLAGTKIARRIGFSRGERAAWITITSVLLASICGLVYYLTRPAFENSESIAVKRKTERAETGHRDVGPDEEKDPDPNSTAGVGPVMGSTDTTNTSNSTENREDVLEDPSDEASANPSAVPNTPDKVEPRNPIKPAPRNDGTPVSEKEPPGREEASSWEDILAPNGFQAEVILPVVSPLRLDDGWKKPATLARFRSDRTAPNLELALLGSDSEICAMTLERVGELGAEWEVSVKQPGKAGSQLISRIDVSQETFVLQFHWADAAQTLTPEVISSLRGAVLKLQAPGVAETKLISFLPALKKEPFKLHVDQLIKSGTWMVPAISDVWIPNGQMSTAYVHISNIGATAPKSTVLDANQSPQNIELGTTNCTLRVEFLCADDGRPSLNLSLIGTDDQTDEQLLFPGWHSKRIAERKECLEEAILDYHREDAFLNNREPRDPDLLRKQLPPGLLKLNAMATSELERLNWQRQGKSIRPYPRHPLLKQHEEQYPNLLKLSGSLRGMLSKCQLDVRITRRIEDTTDPAHQAPPEFEVFLAKKSK